MSDALRQTIRDALRQTIRRGIEKYLNDQPNPGKLPGVWSVHWVAEISHTTRYVAKYQPYGFKEEIEGVYLVSDYEFGVLKDPYQLVEGIGYQLHTAIHNEIRSNPARFAHEKSPLFLNYLDTWANNNSDLVSQVMEFDSNKKENKRMNTNIPETTEAGDFLLVTVAIPKEDVALLRDSRFVSNISQEPHYLAARRTLLAVQAELPTEVVIEVGLTYTYPAEAGGSSYTYTVVQVGEKEAVIRRLKANSRGSRGSRLVETQEKIQHDLRSGRAVVVKDEEPAV